MTPARPANSTSAPATAVPLLVVDLHHQRLRQQAAGLRHLLSAAGFNDGRAERGGLGSSCRFAALREQDVPAKRSAAREAATKADGRRMSGHFLAASCLLRPSAIIRNAVSARASSSLMARFGSIVPGRSACGFFIHA